MLSGHRPHFNQEVIDMRKSLVIILFSSVERRDVAANWSLMSMVK
jgi:hypothetical protein